MNCTELKPWPVAPELKPWPVAQSLSRGFARPEALRTRTPRERVQFPGLGRKGTVRDPGLSRKGPVLSLRRGLSLMSLSRGLSLMRVNLRTCPEAMRTRTATAEGPCSKAPAAMERYEFTGLGRGELYRA